MFVLPTAVFANVDPGGEAQLAFLKLYAIVLALLVLAAGPGVGRSLW